jgi:hypothetical protein
MSSKLDLLLCHVCDAYLLDFSILLALFVTVSYFVYHACSSNSCPFWMMII